jgi:RimJ/RimL family protein N-acetyltransferase
MPHIERHRLRLRPITDNEPSALADLWSDPVVMRYLPTNKPRTLEAIQRELRYMVTHWQDHGFGTWAITRKGNDTFIGYCGIQYLHEERGGVSAEALLLGTDVEIIAALAKPYWKQGIVSEATKATLRYGFETVRLSRIVAATHPENTIGRHVLEKVGLRYDADIHYYDNAPHFVILQEEFNADNSLYVVHTTSQNAL